MNSPYKYNNDFAKMIRDSGFVFDGRRTNVRIDWNEIRAVDVERLIVDRDFRTIDNHLQDVLNCQLETEFDLRILDTGFVKLFRLAQLSVEYLLQCRRHLDMIISSTQEEIKTTKEEKEYLKRQLNSKEDDLRKLQYKLRKRQRNPGYNRYDEVSEFLKGLVLNGSTNTTLSVGEQNMATLSKCLHCDKLFMNQFFLQAHVNRRHFNIVTNSNTADNDEQHESYKAMTEKLHQEIKEMRERLSIAEKRQLDELFNKLTKVDNEIQKEDIESNEKTNATSSNQNELTKEMFEEWKRVEQEKYLKEIETLKGQLRDSLKEINDNIKESTEKADKDVNDEKLSIIADTLNKQQEEVKSLRKKLQDEVVSKENEVSSRLDAQEKQWRSKLQLLEDQYGQIISELKSNMTQQASESQNIQRQYQMKIESLEKNLKSQLQTLEQQSHKLDNLNETNKTLAEMVEKCQTGQRAENFISVSQETLPPYEDTVDIPTPNTDLIKNKNGTIITNYSSDSSIENENTIQNKIVTSAPKNIIERPLSAKKLFEEKLPKEKVEKPTQAKNPKKIVYKSSETSESDSDIPRQNQSIGENLNGIEKVLAKKPHLSKAVKKDLQLLMKKRLKNIGVQPKSKGIATEEFKKALKSIQHKEHLMSKQYHGYKKCRKTIMKRLDNKLKQLDMSEKTSTSSNPEYKTNSPLKAMGSLFSNVKNKAINMVRSKENLIKGQRFENPSSVQEKISAKSILAMLDANNAKLNENTKTRSESSSNLSSDEKEFIDKSGGSARIVTTAISHVPSKSIENLLNSPIRKPSDIPLESNKTSTSPKHKKELIEANTIQSTGRFSKNIASSNLSLDDSITLSETDLDEDVNGLKSFPARKALSEDNVSVKKSMISPKGVLKSVASAGSLTKKKVLFDLDANEMKSVEPSYSLQDSINEDTTKVISDDWDISEDNIQENETFQNYSETINLSTKQSPKIAEISRLVQSQISQRDVKPPAGSIDVVFKTPASSNPVPAPRTIAKNKIDSDLELSDWSIDDIMNDK